MAEELKRAVQIASGFMGTVNTVEGTSNPGHPLHPFSPPVSLGSPKTLLTGPTSYPACLDELSRSPAFSLNSSHSQSNSLSEVKLEPEDYFGAGTGLSFVMIIRNILLSIFRNQEYARG